MKAKKGLTYKKGDIVISPATEADGDWLRARRLKIEGTEEALKELEEMENSPLFEMEPEDLEQGE